MTDPYLIAHLVRGQPAFDIATRMKCPVCEAVMQGLDIASAGCTECDQEGYWWIIPTSGHRAYPSDYIKLAHLLDGAEEKVIDQLALPSSGHPDHYSPTAAPRGQGLITNLAERLGFVSKPKVSRR